MLQSQLAPLMGVLWDLSVSRLGGTLTSLAADVDSGSPSASDPEVTISFGLDRPSLPRYPDAPLLPASELAALLGLAQGGTVHTLFASLPPGPLVRVYHAGSFVEQAATPLPLRPLVRPGTRDDAAGLPLVAVGRPFAGFSIGGIGARSGSICAAVRVGGAWTHVLSCAHVLVPVTANPAMTLMPSPSHAAEMGITPLRCARVGQAALYTYGPDAGGVELPDAALARLDVPATGPSVVLGHGVIKRVRAPTGRESVRMLGSTTRGVDGTVRATLAFVNSAGRRASHVLFRCDYASENGDSGGLVYALEGGEVVALGMHAGRELDLAYAMDLPGTLETLGKLGIDTNTGLRAEALGELNVVE